MSRHEWRWTQQRCATSQRAREKSLFGFEKNYEERKKRRKREKRRKRGRSRGFSKAP